MLGKVFKVFAIATPASLSFISVSYAQAPKVDPIPIIGKWYGVVSCYGRVIKSDVTIKKSGSGLISQWKLGANGTPAYRYGLTSGERLITYHAPSYQFLIGPRNRPERVGMAVGNPDAIIFQTRDECSDLILFRDKNQRKALKKSAEGFEGQNLRALVIERVTSRYHDAAAAKLIAFNLPSKLIPDYVRQRLSNIGRSQVSQYENKEKTTFATRRLAEKYASYTSDGIDSLREYLNISQLLHGFDIEYKLIDKSVLNTLRKDFQIKIDQGFSAIINQEVTRLQLVTDKRDIEVSNAGLRRIASFGSRDVKEQMIASIDVGISPIVRRAERAQRLREFKRELAKDSGDFKASLMRLFTIGGWGFAVKENDEIDSRLIAKDIEVLGKPAQIQLQCARKFPEITFRLIIPLDVGSIDNRLDVIADGQKTELLFLKSFENSRIADFVDKSRMNSGGRILKHANAELNSMRNAETLKIYTYLVTESGTRRVFLTDLGKAEKFSLDDAANVCGIYP